MALVLDTGPVFASLDRRDPDHLACRRLLESTTEQLVIPALVLVEVEQLVHARLPATAFNALLDDIGAGACRLEWLDAADLGRVRYLCERYADARIGIVDASVLATVERLGEPKLATLDRRHFTLLRPRHVSALTLLPD